jgi:uncharacterized oligopeptide transporter (OPT) family protein
LRNEEEFTELVHAKIKVRREKQQRRRKFLAVAGGTVLALALVVPYIISSAPRIQSLPQPATGDAQIVMGDAVIGGYLFVALCGLIIGVVVTLLCRRAAKKRNRKT